MRRCLVRQELGGDRKPISSGRFPLAVASRSRSASRC
jgi:hypothetical protein